MKKFSVLIAALAMLATSLIGLSAAADASSPYPGTVKTTCRISYPHKISHKRALKVRPWVTSSSNLRATGTIKLTVTRKGRHSKTYHYGGGAALRNLGKLKKGKHRILLSYKPKSGSVFKGCARRGHIIKVK